MVLSGTFWYFLLHSGTSLFSGTVWYLLVLFWQFLLLSCNSMKFLADSGNFCFFLVIFGTFNIASWITRSRRAKCTWSSFQLQSRGPFWNNFFFAFLITCCPMQIRICDCKFNCQLVLLWGQDSHIIYCRWWIEWPIFI